MAIRSKPTIDDELIDPLLEAPEHSAACTSATVSTPRQTLALAQRRDARQQRFINLSTSR